MHVIIRYEDGTRRTISWPKYILGQHLGRELTHLEEADHIDSNRFNNDISNLRVVSREENGRFYMAQFPAEFADYTCPVCGTVFKKSVAIVRHNQKQGKAGPFCDKSCAAKGTFKKGINRGRKINIADAIKPKPQ